VPGLSINRYCASGLSAVHLAAQEAMACDGLAAAGGVEMMSRVPMASDKGPLTHDLEFQRRPRWCP
jgi:acetyl-CoA C-acetyltransferase